MSFAKFLPTVLVLVPFLGLSAQTSQQSSDSSGNNSVKPWLITGTGIASGAGLFAAFVNKGHHGQGAYVPVQTSANGFTDGPGTVNPPDDPPAPPSDPSDDPSNSAAPSDSGTTSNVAPSQDPPGNTIFTEETPQDPPSHDPPDQPDPSGPQLQDQPPQVTTTPEPGSLALLATGLVALAPVVRRRGKR